METGTFENNKSNITLNLDEFDIDSYDFKPVTKGLGFHEEKERKVRPVANTGKSAKLHQPARTVINTSSSSRSSHLQNVPSTVSDPGLMSGLDAIYSKEEISKEPVKKATKKKESLKEASLYTMAAAYTLDLIVIGSIALLLFASFFLFVARVMDMTLFNIFLEDSIGFVAVMTGLIYLTYFSLLEPVGTLGKKYFGLATYQVGNTKRITIKNSFIRSLISLCSIPLLIFPLLFDFQGKLSDSRVLKIKE